MSQAREHTVGRIIVAAGLIGIAAVGCSSPQAVTGSRTGSAGDTPQASAGAHAVTPAQTTAAPVSTSANQVGSTVLPPPTMTMEPAPQTASTDDTPVNQDNACGTGSVSAELSRVNMLVMFDRSNSMEENGKWQSATAALSKFFEDPSADGLGVALRFFPHDEPAVGCTMDACDATACAQPLVEVGALHKELAPMDAQEDRLLQAIIAAAPMGRAGGGRGGGGGGGGTPIYAALDGALRWATSYKAAHTAEKTVVIFVTDGQPNGCDEDFNNIAALASDALSSAKITTYAIGLEGSSEAQMDQLAAAGGTDKGIFIGSGANAEQELLDALNAIRGAAISCDFPVPAPSSATQQVDLNKLNVTFTRGNGSAATFRQVPAEAECKKLGAWYYDDPMAPQRIVLCPTACDAVQKDPGARIEILIGCTTCGGLDQNCNEGTPPEVPPLF